MRKAFKIILAILAVFIIIVVAFGAVFALDVSAYTAAGAKTLTPTGISAGNALVVYDPGWSGLSTKIADKVATDLQAKGYTVTLTGVKSGEAANTAGYSIIVAGSPYYAGSPTSSLKDYLGGLNPANGTKVAVFCSGSSNATPDDAATIKSGVPALQSSGTLSGAVVVKIGEKEDLNARALDLANQLTS